LSPFLTNWETDMTPYRIEALTARLRRLRHILWSAAGQFSTGEINRKHGHMRFEPRKLSRSRGSFVCVVVDRRSRAVWRTRVVLIRTIRKFSIYSCIHILRMQFISVLFLRSATRDIAAHDTFFGTAAPPLPAPAVVVPSSPPPAA
jgi:hypothetical protein